jgi:hypothetical protein
MQPISKQRLNKHVPANTKQWELCSLWAILQLVARLHNNSDNRGECFLCGPCRGYITRFPSTVALRVVGGDKKGSLESGTVKYGRESHGTRIRE